MRSSEALKLIVDAGLHGIVSYSGFIIFSRPFIVCMVMSCQSSACLCNLHEHCLP